MCGVFVVSLAPSVEGSKGNFMFGGALDTGQLLYYSGVDSGRFWSEFAAEWSSSGHTLGGSLALMDVLGPEISPSVTRDG